MARSHMVDFGSIGGDSLAVTGSFRGKRGRALVSWGEDIDEGREGYDPEFAGWFSSLGKAIGGVAKSVGKVVTSRPFVTALGGVATLAVPGAGPLIGGVTVAASIAAKAASKKKSSTRRQARKVVRGSIRLGTKARKRRKNKIRVTIRGMKRVRSAARVNKARRKKLALAAKRTRSKQRKLAIARRLKAAKRTRLKLHRRMLKLKRARRKYSRPGAVERGGIIMKNVVKARKLAKVSGRPIAWVTSNKGFVYRVK